MKNTILALFVGMTSISAHAEDLNCGYRGQIIPEALVAGLENPGCIALDAECPISLELTPHFSRTDPRLFSMLLTPGFSINDPR